MTPPIQSAQHPQVKRLKSLALDASFRREQGSYLIEGEKLVREALQAGAKARLAVLSAKGPLRAEIAKAGIPLLELGDKAFASAAGTDSPQGVLLELELPKPPKLPSQLKLALAAERIQDPGNLGSLLRSAWACGVEAVLLSEGCADPYAPKTLRAAAGAQLWLQIEVQSPLEKRLAAMRQSGVAIFALDPKAERSLWKADLSKPACLLVGSEGQGLSQELKAMGQGLRLDYPGQCESLNAAVSASIALFELLRQRFGKN